MEKVRTKTKWKDTWRKGRKDKAVELPMQVWVAKISSPTSRRIRKGLTPVRLSANYQNTKCNLILVTWLTKQTKTSKAINPMRRTLLQNQTIIHNQAGTKDTEVVSMARDRIHMTATKSEE